MQNRLVIENKKLNVIAFECTSLRSLQDLKTEYDSGEIELSDIVFTDNFEHLSAMHFYYPTLLLFNQIFPDYFQIIALGKKKETVSYLCDDVFEFLDGKIEEPSTKLLQCCLSLGEIYNLSLMISSFMAKKHDVPEELMIGYCLYASFLANSRGMSEEEAKKIAAGKYNLTIP